MTYQKNNFPVREAFVDNSVITYSDLINFFISCELLNLYFCWVPKLPDFSTDNDLKSLGQSFELLLGPWINNHPHIPSSAATSSKSRPLPKSVSSKAFRSI